MPKIGKAAAVMSAAALLSGGLLASGASASTHSTSPRADVWYTFQNVGSDRNLDAFGNNSVTSWTPDASGTQDFYLRIGSFPGYQMESKRYPGRCATAKGIGQQIALDNCNRYIQAQYWNYSVYGDGAPFQSRKYPASCIQDDGLYNSAVLRPCNGADNQRWMALVQ